MKKGMLLLALILATLLTARFCAKDPRSQHVGPGESLPAFAVTTLDGHPAGRETLLGRPSVLILFTTTCGDCRLQLPEVEALWRECGEAGVNVLAVARDDGPEAVAAYWKAAGYTMPAAAPGDRSVYDLFDRGSRSGVPQVYLSSPDGTVRATWDDSATATKEEMMETIMKTIQ